MNFTKKLSIIVFSFTTTLISTAVITNTYNAAVQAAELVKNGSFELDPLVDPNNPNATNPNITDWTKSGDQMDISGIRISNFPEYNSGNQGLSLSGFLGLSYISQTLSTQPGQQYELSYYLASIDEAPDLDNQFQTFVGGNKIFDQEDISFQPYTPYKFNFTADASSTELKFGNWDRKGFLFLDNVSVKPVPEPSTIGGVAVAVSIGIWLKKKKAIS
ncbi:PEP-CTERM sorting domain-containing protein [uncultured Nostoc sp.]|uniref:PEP-CTERM sorting domain-containing protein n=1 Tax=uncultured Nostoc sp. TaxID=340711 RepID=UPI0035CC8E7C